MQFLVPHRAISRTWSFELAVQPVFCSDSDVLCPWQTELRDVAKGCRINS